MSYDVHIGDFSQNITFNLGKFFRAFINEEHGITILDQKTGCAAGSIVATAISNFAIHQFFNTDEAITEEFSSPNGWGTWEDAIHFLTKLLDACLQNPRKTVRVYC